MDPQCRPIQRKSMNCKIASIKFSIIHKHKPKPAILSITAFNQPTSIYSRTNSFIPKSQVRSLSQLMPHPRPIIQALLPANPSSQCFPYRRSVSSRATKLFIPVYRQRRYSFANYTNPEKAMTESTKKSVRMNARSCMSLNVKEEVSKDSFRQYAQTTEKMSKTKAYEMAKREVYNSEW